VRNTRAARKSPREARRSCDFDDFKGTHIVAMAEKRTPTQWFFLISVALSFAVLWELIVPLSVGAVLAYVSERPIDKVTARLGRNTPTWRAIVAVGFVLAVTAVVLVPLGLAVYVAVRDLARLIASKDSDEWARTMTRGLEWGAAWLQRRGIEMEPAEMSERATTFLKANAGRAAGYLGALLSATPNAIFNGLVILLAWIYLAIDGPGARDRILIRLIPWKAERDTIRTITAEVIQGTIVANLAVSFLQAIAMSLTLLILRVPRPFVWGVLTFFLSFVPVVGIAPVILGAAGYLVANGRTGAAIAAVIFGFVAASLDNVLRPLFLRGSSVELNFLWVLVALIGGVALFGLPGVILGPLAFSLLVAALRSLEAMDQAVTEKNDA
jgi:predicted PurR-regulated permease PerM